MAQRGITIRQWLPLIGLTCAAFIFNTSEFMPIGLLTDISASFHISEAATGVMISVFPFWCLPAWWLPPRMPSFGLSHR